MTGCRLPGHVPRIPVCHAVYIYVISFYHEFRIIKRYRRLCVDVVYVWRQNVVVRGDYVSC